MLVEEVVLLEAKDEYVVKAFGPKILQRAQETGAKWQGSRLLMKKKPNDVIPADKVAEATLSFVREKLVPLDPTPNQKYLVWIAKLYSDGKLKEEDFYKVPESLTLFGKVQPKLAQKDIMQYKSLQDLFRALAPFENEEAQKSGKEKRKEERAEAISGAELVYNTAEFKIYRINTKEAACELGKGTKWCTAATRSQNYFKEYADGGTLYAVIPTQPVQDGPYQMYFPNPTSGGYDNFQAADKFDDSMGIDNLVLRMPGLKSIILELFKKHKSPITDSFTAVYGDKIVRSMPIESRTPIVTELLDDYFGYSEKTAAQVVKIINAAFTPSELKAVMNHPRVTGFINDAIVDADSPMDAIREASRVFGGVDNVRKIVRKFTDQQFSDIFTSLMNWGREPTLPQLSTFLEFSGKSKKQFLKYLMQDENARVKLFKWMVEPEDKLEKVMVEELTPNDRLAVIRKLSEESITTLINKINHAYSFKNFTPKEMTLLAEAVLKGYVIRKRKLPKDTYTIKFLPSLKDLNTLYIKLTGDKIDNNKIEIPVLSTMEKGEGRLAHVYEKPDFTHGDIQWFQTNSSNSLIKAFGGLIPDSKNALDATLSTGFVTARPNGFLLLVVAQGIYNHAWLTVVPYGKEDSRTVFADLNRTRIYSYEQVNLNDAKLKASIEKLITEVREDSDVDIELDTTEFQESKK